MLVLFKIMLVLSFAMGNKDPGGSTDEVPVRLGSGNNKQD